MTARLKLLALAIRYVAVSFYGSARLRLRAAYKRSYYRIHCGAHVHSGDVAVPSSSESTFGSIPAWSSFQASRSGTTRASTEIR